MIEWMHHHKKWLIITIWIATISFILAGAVGWGSLSFGKKADTVARIGDTEVRLGDVQEVYQNIFDMVNRQMGGKLDDATATKMGLKDEALRQAIRQGYFRELARRLHLRVTDGELAKLLQARFKDKKIYDLYLQRIGMLKRDYEDMLRREMVVGKLFSYLHLTPSPLEIESYGSALYNGDKLKIKVVEGNLTQISITPEEINKFYNSHKNQFMSGVKYKIELVKVPVKGNVSQPELEKYYQEHRQEFVSSTGEILPLEKVKGEVEKAYLAHKLKREAFKKYLGLKKGEIHGEFIEVKFNNPQIPSEGMEQLKKRGFMKPLLVNGEYLIGKLVKTLPSQPLPLEEVKGKIEQLLRAKKLKAQLEKEGEKLLQGELEGEETNYLTKFDIDKVPHLTPEEGKIFLGYLFQQWKPKGYIVIGNKLVAYQIVDQKLLVKEEFEKAKPQVKQLAEGVINDELIEDLFNQLTQQYKFTSYMK
jgi:peptidyl-prolyl cis-trans isomerase D